MSVIQALVNYKLSEDREQVLEFIMFCEKQPLGLLGKMGETHLHIGDPSTWGPGKGGRSPW